MSEHEVSAAPVCYRHPDRVSYLACSRCGRPICGDCAIDAAVGQRCPHCVMEQGTQRVVRRPVQRTITQRAPATSAIIGLTVLAYLLAAASETASLWFVLVPAVVEAGEWWRILSHTLGHGGIFHIAMNMYALYILGPPLEMRLGTPRFAAIWVFSAVTGGVAVTYLADPLSWTVGASGAVFGLFGLWLGNAWAGRRTVAGRAQLRSIGTVLIINVFISLMPNVSWQGHLGGLLGGLAAFWLVRALKDKNQFVSVLLTAAAALVLVTQL